MEEDRPTPEPDESVTRVFAEWRSPRFGRSNPERMNNPLWEWLIRSRVNGYSATQRFKGPSACEAGPTWCFDRFGQSRTELPDGRNVLIGGEHEDSYDPDFCIYNDVVVEHPDGALDIFGYPREVFRPTDFHSATLLTDRVLIIGSLGYPQDRRPGVTQVYELTLPTFKISEVEITGSSPGWIHDHQSQLKGDSVLVRGGKIDNGNLVENIDDWELNLTSMVWRRLTTRKWSQWEFLRTDSHAIEIWRIRSDQQMRDLGLGPTMRDAIAKLPTLISEFMRQQPSVPESDIAALYSPPVEHRTLPTDENEFGVYRISVDGVTVRYVEEVSRIRMICEGQLPSTTVETLVSDLQSKLSIAERTTYIARPLV